MKLQDSKQMPTLSIHNDGPNKEKLTDWLNSGKRETARKPRVLYSQSARSILYTKQ